MQLNFLGLLRIVFITEEKTSKHIDQKKIPFLARAPTDNLLQLKNLNLSAISRSYPHAYRLMANERQQDSF